MDTSKMPPFRKQVVNDLFQVAEFIELLHWLKEQGAEASLDTIVELYRRGVIVGQYWNEVLYDLRLPDDPDWGIVALPNADASRSGDGSRIEPEDQAGSGKAGTG